MDEPRRDDVFDRELRRALAAEGAAAAGPHVDAELAAAWMDRQLDPAIRRSVDAHLAGCHECQLLMATLARTAPEPAAPVPAPWWRLRAGWLVPATAAAAAALVIWIALPQQRGASTTSQMPAPAAAEAQRNAANVELPPPAAAPTVATPAPVPAAPAAPAASAAAVPLEQDERRVDAAKENRLLDAQTAPAAEAKRADTATVTGDTPVLPQPRQEANAAPPPAASPAASLQGALLRQRAAPERFAGALTFAAPDGNALWRRNGARIEFAPRADAPFRAATLPDGAAAESVAAGASPGGTICWLAGTGGLVLVTTDGVRFARVAGPAAVDFTGIVATDARTATVTAADGRRFQTTNAGASWTALP